MDLEIDFLPVGESSKSGDAIVLRYGDLSGHRNGYSVIVIDAGFPDTGEKVIEHIIDNYKTDHIDLVVSSHSDNDHSGGIPILLEVLSVGKIWMHKPWNHTKNISSLFEHQSVSDTSVRNNLIKSLETAKNIERIAEKKGIPIIEPFTGTKDDRGGLLVLGPDEKFYKEELIPNFKCTPIPIENSIAKLLSKGLGRAVQTVKEYLDESWDIELLDNSGATSAENNSSTILLLDSGNEHVLFTADAGQPALERVIALLDLAGYDYSKIKLKQVPHHGSYRNINPIILDKLIGPRLSEDPEKPIKEVVVSVCREENEKHPSKMVANACRRRGAPIHSTREGLKYYGSGNAPRKHLHSVSTPLPFYPKVEKHD